MNLQLGPVVRGLRGHRAAAIVVALQFAVGLAITVVAALIADYVVSSQRTAPATIDRDLTIVEVQSAAPAVHGAGLDRIAGAIAATAVDGIPLHVLEKDLDVIRLAAAHAHVASYGTGPRVVETTGLRLRAGRDFRPDDLACQPSCSAIITASLAEALSPGRDPLGMRVESRAFGPAIVVGVIDDPRTHLFSTELTALFAVERRAASSVIVVRSEPERAAETRAALVQLRVPGQHAVVTPALQTLPHLASPVSSVLAILGIIVGSIVVVVLIGSMGLTYFLVASRTREIGLRRAMGARRRDVVRYFLIENAILTAAGTLLGLAIVLALLPALFYEQEDFVMNWPLVAITVGAVIALDLLATLIPARKAAAVSPVVASRT